jgi:hypothetical protein
MTVYSIPLQAEVDLLIRAHFCFSLAHQVQGTNHILAIVKGRVQVRTLRLGEGENNELILFTARVCEAETIQTARQTHHGHQRIHQHAIHTRSVGAMQLL